MKPTAIRVIAIREDNGEILTARWRELDSFDWHHRLVPEQLSSLVQSQELALYSYPKERPDIEL